MIVDDAISRIDEVLNEKPLPEIKSKETLVNSVPIDNSITLEHVSYAYDKAHNSTNSIPKKCA